MLFQLLVVIVQGQDTKSTTVIYKAPIPGPTVDIKSPASNPWTSPVDKVNITAIAKHVASKSGHYVY